MRSMSNLIVAALLGLVSITCGARVNKSQGSPSGGKPSPISREMSCAGSAGANHPSMIACIQAETADKNRQIVKILGSRYDSPTREVVAGIRANERGWEDYVERKCRIYFLLGGQRGELLRESCVLNEAVLHEKYVNELIFLSENS